MGSEVKPWWHDYVKWGPPAVGFMAIGTAFIDFAWLRALISVWLIAAAFGLGEVRALRETLADALADADKTEMDRG